ncbi:ferric reductase-like transmembrane domain-containing protein [Nitrosomonas communis]|uniref:Predicted ferric reductase n=1 Tax=Nitrosomonas communis TaxID=44574 RepID=A0A1H2TL05_9PROT|nr:ferric reductase-like transmembrane domain-containing protein [Nitrosomonas communis]SDW43954.1 Predicted ferric reductase [Nitrosomonas communis]
MKYIIIALALLPALMKISSLPFNAYGFGLLSGWLGMSLIAASLLLIIREPAWTDWFGGLQHMYLWHHRMGMMGYVLLLAHPLILSSHYFELDLDVAWQYLSPFNPDPINMVGWTGLITFMLGLAATFTQRLSYSLWRRLHMLLVGAIMLGLGHIWMADSSSVSFVIACFTVALAIGWRIIRGDYGIGAFPYEVNAVYHPTEQITEVSLRSLAKPMLIAPGQFVNAAFFQGPNFQGCGEFHPYTVSRVAKDGSLSLNIKALGYCTKHIQSLEPGVAVHLQGPYGNFLLDRPFSPEIWIAAGIGITPFLALLRSDKVDQKTDLIYLHREKENVPFEKELQTYAANQELLHFHSLAMENDPTLLFKWLASISRLKEQQIYLCGPPLLIALTTSWLQEQGVSRRQIHFEQFDFR